MDNPSGNEDRFVIVIGREYGSGGRRIGRMLARELGVTYYDKTLLKEAASRLGYSTDIFELKDERRPSLIRSILSFTYGAQTANIDGAPMSDEKIYEFQSRVIQDICRNESCVIVGRSADYVLREHPGLISIFVHAPLEERAKAIMDRGETDNLSEAREKALNIDKNRESFYNYYTNRQGWGKSANYHLSFDSTKISSAALIDIVKDMIRSRHKKQR